MVETDTSSADNPVRDVMLTLASLVVILAGARLAADLLVPFLLSLFIAIILSGPIYRLKRRGLPYWLAASIVGFMALGTLVVVALVLVSSANAFASALPQYQAQLNVLVESWTDWMVTHGVNVDRQDFSDALNPSAAFGFLANFLSGLSGALSHLFLILLTVIFILADTTRVGDRLSSRCADDRHSRRAAELQALIVSMNSYMSTKALMSLITGLLVSLGLWLLDVKFAIFWGFVAFLLNFVPNIGSIIAALPPVLLSLLEHDPLLTGAIIVLYISMNTLMGNIIEPRIMGQRLGLSTLAVFLSLFFWGWMFGAVGMLLSVPLTMVIKFIAMQQPASAWFATLISASMASRDEVVG